MSTWDRVIDLGRRQGGVVALRQAVAIGVPRTTAQERTQRDGWLRPYPGVVLLPGVAPTPAVLTRAAALSVGEHATVTGESALHLLGVCDQPPVRIHLVVPASRRAASLIEVQVTRSRTLVPADRERLDGCWVATPPRAFLDLAARSSRDRLRILLIDARQRGVVTIGLVVERALGVSRAPGRGRLLHACADVDSSGADSALVAAVEHRLRVEEGIDLDVPPRTVRTVGRVLHPDLTIRGLSVAIEVDGFGVHRDRRALDLDQRKHNQYQLAGWIVLRISWTRFKDDWDGFVAELRTAIAAARQARSS